MGKEFSPRDLLAQKELIDLGYDLGSAGADGWWGVKSETAFQIWLDTQDLELDSKLSQQWPEDKESALNAFFGKPDFQRKVAPNRFRITELPYPMYLAWSMKTQISSISCNKKVANSLKVILKNLVEHFGADGIEKFGLNKYGGMINVRRARGQNWPSRHSWGIAIDLNPAENGLWTKKPQATMPIEACEIFEEQGWLNLGRLTGTDWMHYQCTQLPSNYPKFG